MHAVLDVEEQECPDLVWSMVLRILVNDQIQVLAVPFCRVHVTPRGVESQEIYIP